MANQEHLDILKQGVKVWNKWREENPNLKIDLREANMESAVLDGANLFKANLFKANLTLAHLHNANLNGAYLGKAKLDWANLSDANLSNADLTEADLTKANLFMANLSKANLFSVNLKLADLGETDLGEANLEKANLEEARLDKANLDKANLREANLSKADLSKASLREASLREANLSKANLFEANLSEADFLCSKWPDSCMGVETVVLGKGLDVKYFETTKQIWISRFLNWGEIRKFGKLPLFSISYISLLGIVVSIYVLSFYNSKVSTVKGALEKASYASNDPGEKVLYESIVEGLNYQQIPALSWLFVVSSIFLAIATTIYTLRCPSRVQSFSKEIWVNQNQKQLIYYWAMAWKYPVSRLICAFSYLVGGLGLLTFIVVKVWNATYFIFENMHGIQ